MPVLRSLGVWAVIMLAEVVHGTARVMFLQPYVGDFRARQIAVFTGSAMIIAIAVGLIRWIRATSTAQLFAVGFMWLVLTLAFELFLGRMETRLSPAALEALSIIAFKQPVIRAEIEAIRGVNSGGVLGTLLERGLIRIVGRSEALGRPLLYGTTKKFLRYFVLNTLSDLPKPKEIEELLRQREGEQRVESQVEQLVGSGGDRGPEKVRPAD